MPAQKKGTAPHDDSYVKTARAAYGDACEYRASPGGPPCGWAAAPCDVHHIAYNEHETRERQAGAQLPKDNSSANLCVLCPNHHRQVHHDDIGCAILACLPPRKTTVRFLQLNG